MKKKNKIIIAIISIVGIITISLIWILLNKDKEPEKVSKYSNVVVDQYQIQINDDYEFKYDKELKEGYLTNKRFLSSFLYVSEEKYGELILSSSYYTNMGAKELDTSIEEVKFGTYDGFINEKKVYYEDVDDEYHLVIILVKVSDTKTFVVQYEVLYDDDHEEILNDIKEGLNKIKKIN